jgi:hypothetical protein
MPWTDARLKTMRQAFFTALEDPKHPVWDALLDGIAGHTSGIFDVMHRHPFGHGCQQCCKWRRENPDLAQIEQQVLDRRVRAAA